MRYDIVKIMNYLADTVGADFFTRPIDELCEKIDCDDDIGRQKLYAGLSLLGGDLFWESFPEFENIVNALVERPVIINRLQVPSAAEIIYVVKDIVPKIRLKKYSDEVLSYIAATMVNDGLLWVPPGWLPGGVLDKMKRLINDYPVKVINDVRSLWEVRKIVDLSEDTPANVQLRKLIAIEEWRERQ